MVKIIDEMYVTLSNTTELQVLPKKYKSSKETTVNNYMLTNWKTYKKKMNL